MEEERKGMTFLDVVILYLKSHDRASRYQRPDSVEYWDARRDEHKARERLRRAVQAMARIAERKETV